MQGVYFFSLLLSYAFVVMITIEQDYRMVLYKLVLIRNKGVKGSCALPFVVRIGRRKDVSKSLSVNRRYNV